MDQVPLVRPHKSTSVASLVEDKLKRNKVITFDEF